MENDNSFPVVVKDFKKSYFGLVTIKYYVENRRPDLGNNFKHYLNVRILFTRFNWTFHTEYANEELPFIENLVTHKVDGSDKMLNVV